MQESTLMSLSDFVKQRIGALKCPLHDVLNMGNVGELYAHYLIGQGDIKKGNKEHDIHLPSGKIIEVKTGVVQRECASHSAHVCFSNIRGSQRNVDWAGLILIAYFPEVISGVIDEECSFFFIQRRFFDRLSETLHSSTSWRINTDSRQKLWQKLVYKAQVPASSLRNIEGLFHLRSKMRKMWYPNKIRIDIAD